MERLRGLQTGSAEELHILRVIDGDWALERAIHKKFKHDNVHGEWFKPTRKILKFMTKYNRHTFKNIGSAYDYKLPDRATIESLPCGEEIIWFNI